MGLDYSYVLYFPQEKLWEVLDRVGALAGSQTPGTRILFEDHHQHLPLNDTEVGLSTFPHTHPCFHFSISLGFPLDASIREYIQGRGGQEPGQGSDDPQENPDAWIGTIDLWVYQDLSSFSDAFHEPDLVSLVFQANGTRMSLLFDESPQIRETFLRLLEDYEGVGGLIDYEVDAVLFQWRGQPQALSVGSMYTSPTEIDAMVDGGW